jgi:pantoate--beta-alanine ligase
MQCIVIKRFTEDLNIPVDIVTVPTEREPDGLAMSSRNTYLSPQERLIAPVLYKALSAAKKSFHEQKVRDSQSLIDAATKVISTEPAVKLDYLDICDLSTGSEIKTVEESGAMLSGAILVGKTRLIDNIILKDE